MGERRLECDSCVVSAGDWSGDLKWKTMLQLIIMLILNVLHSDSEDETLIMGNCASSRRPEPNGSHALGDLKQARTAMAVNKQLNFTVKNKPHTTNYIYCIFEAYFMIKSV